MLPSRKHDEWSLTEHKDRDYETETEKRFFEAVEHPKPAPAEIKEIYRAYAKYFEKAD